jgi:hypothetical protein
MMFQRTAEGYPLIKTEKIKKIKKIVGIGSSFDSRYNTPPLPPEGLRDFAPVASCPGFGCVTILYIL